MYNFYGGYRGRDFIFKTVYPNYRTMIEKGSFELNLGEFCLINFCWDSKNQIEDYSEKTYNENRGEELEELHNTLWRKVKGQGEEGFKQIFSFEPLGAAVLQSESLQSLELIINGGTSKNNTFSPDTTLSQITYDGGNLEETI